MKRRQLLIGVAAVTTQLWLAGAASAAGLSDQIVAQLRNQGFGSIVIERTWLGRTRILAERNDAKREIILNPATGEILRDLWLSKSGNVVEGARISVDNVDADDSSGRGGDDGAGDDDDDDDSGDDDDDDDGEDNSGSGSGND